MQALGHIENGVVILDTDVSLPEGTRVRVEALHPAPRIELEPGKLPTVYGGAPGAVKLSKQRIEQILEEEDIQHLEGS